MESLVTARVVARIVTQVLMLCLDMVLQVTLTQKGLVAALVGANERTLVGVRALMLGEAYRAGIGLSTAGKVAQKLLLT